jgi:dTMP kinase
MQETPPRGNPFIVIEGMDGAGKSTQIDLLIAHFQAKGIETRFIHFPRHNDGVFGTLIARFLRGEFGEVKDVHPQLVALMFAEDRRDFASTLRAWLAEGHAVLCDRYVLSNIAFQCAKLSDPQAKAELRDWILDFEFNYNGIPRPDFSLYLSVPFAFTEQSLNARLAAQARAYLAGGQDIHEKDFSLQRAVKQEYETMVATDHSIIHVACNDAQDNMLPIAAIHARILDLIGG